MPLKLRIHLQQQLHAACTSMGAGFFSKLKAHADVFGPDGPEHCALIDAYRNGADPAALPESTQRWLMRVWAHLGHFPEKDALRGSMAMAYGLAHGLHELVFLLGEEESVPAPAALAHMRLQHERKAIERHFNGQERLDALAANRARVQRALSGILAEAGHPQEDGPTAAIGTPARPQARTYVSSDLLPRLVQSLHNESFERVRMLHEVYFGDKTLKWQLIQYYRDLQGPWSKERENADWSGVRLSHHKWLATQWLRDALTQVGDFPQHTILHDVLELQHALHLGLSEWVLARVDEALAQARAAEHFAAVHVLLRLELQALKDAGEPGPQAANAQALQHNADGLIEVETATDIRHRLMAVIQQRRTGDVDAYARASAEVMGHEAQCATARAIHAHNRQLLLHETGQAEAALAQGLSGIRLLGAHPELAAGDMEAFCRQVYHALWIASELGRYEEVLAQVPAMFREAAHTVQNPQLRLSFLASQLAAGIFGKREDLTRQAVMAFAQEADLLRHEAGALRDWVVFQLVQWSLNAREWALAGAFIQGAAAGRPAWGTRYVAHMRLFQLLHLWATESDLEFVESAIASAKTFLRRREGKESFYVEVLACLEGLARVRLGENGSRAAALERVRRRVMALGSTPKEARQADMFPYRSYLLGLCGALA